MNERIKELAVQAGLAFSHDYDYWVAWDDEIERFAELVRQDYLRELKALKPVAWVVRRTTSEGIMADGVWTCDSDEEGAIPVYALDEVKHD